MRDYIVVFGAGVRPDGTPSAALQHRIDGAIQCALRFPQARIMPTGAIGEHGSAEAVVIRRALVKAGIRSSRIVIEPTGRDTLESVRRCHALLERQGDCGRIICCTSTYHQTRCAMLFRLLGYRVINARVPNSFVRLSVLSYARLLLKEAVATPYDGLLLVAFH